MNLWKKNHFRNVLEFSVSKYAFQKTFFTINLVHSSDDFVVITIRDEILRDAIKIGVCYDYVRNSKCDWNAIYKIIFFWKFGQKESLEHMFNASSPEIYC